MKHSTIFIAASAFLAITLLIFLAGSFTAASFDIRTWGEARRCDFSMIWIVGAPIVSLFAAIFEDSRS